MTTKSDKDRLRGLVRLVTDAVDHGAGAIERVHLGTTKRTFDVLGAIPLIALPARGVQRVHDLSVRGTYGAVRLVTRAVGGTLGVAIDAAPDAPPADASPAASPDAPPDAPS